MAQDDRSPVRALVIHGSQTIRRASELHLSEAGCEVLLAQDGFDALRRS